MARIKTNLVPPTKQKHMNQDTQSLLKEMVTTKSKIVDSLCPKQFMISGLQWISVLSSKLHVTLLQTMEFWDDVILSLALCKIIHETINNAWWDTCHTKGENIFAHLQKWPITFIIYFPILRIIIFKCEDITKEIWVYFVISDCCASVCIVSLCVWGLTMHSLIK